MSIKVDISEAEWRIMKCLWDRSPLEVKDVIASIGVGTGWNGNTIRTLIVRLINKGAIVAEKERKVYRYRPAVSESECVLQKTEDFLERIFDGSATKMFATLTQAGKLCKKDFEEIEAIISRMKDGE